MKILLVEDDLVDQMAFSRWMSKNLNPCRLTIANGVKAVANMSDINDFEIIVCDYHLPDGTVLDVAQLVDPNLIICISGLSDPQKVAEIKRANIPNFLFKDNHLDYLNQLIQIIDQMPVSSTINQPHPSPSEGEKQLIDLNYLLRAFDHKPKHVRDIIEIFLQQSPKQLKALNEAIHNQQLADSQAIAHRLKSSYRMMGLFSQMEMLENIENASRDQVKNQDFYLQIFQQLENDTQLAYAQLQNELQKY